MTSSITNMKTGGISLFGMGFSRLSFRSGLAWLCGFWLCGLLSCIALHASAVDAPLREDQAKAALLYNVIKHTRWPAEQDLPQFIIQFYGQDESIVNAFKSISSQVNVRGKPLLVRAQALFPAHKDYQILVLDRTLSSQLDEIAARLSHSGILLVSDDAADKKSVMLNFTRPESRRISFEVNRSNIVYEGLSISKDVLLYGGSEIEVAVMYKEMESLLLNIKDDVRVQREQLDKQENTLREQEAQIGKKEQQFAVLQNELARKARALSHQQNALQTIQTELMDSRDKLQQTRQQLGEKNDTVAGLETKIQRQLQVLENLSQKIRGQQQTLNAQSLMVSEQAATIDKQRNILIVVLCILLLITLYIIVRQKQAIQREKQLCEAKAALVKAQQESIGAYESSLQLKNDFLTAINHELRTPMNGIIGELQIVDRNNPISMRSCLNSVSKSADQMMIMVDDILTYIEIQSEQLSIQFQCVETQRFFDGLFQHYQKRCQAKGLQLQWQMPDNMPSCLRLDGGNLLKALQKILDNALKFSNAGQIVVSLNYQPGDDQSGENGDWLTCMVDDSGPGLQSDEKEHVFEAFRQRESGLTRRYSGLGIGLAICQKLVLAMGGEVSLGNRREGGCRAVVRLPVSEGAAGASWQQAFVIEPTQSQNTLQPILVVEDNDVNSKILQKMLEKLGYDSLLACDGVEALRILEQHQPALILMDLQMPVMDGFDCTKAIRAASNETAGVPIIAVTANMLSAQRNHCEAVGMNGFLDKPVSLAKLNQTLKQFLSVDQVG